MGWGPLEVVVRPRAGDVAAWLRRREPVVLAGLAASWPAIGTWTPDALAARLGARHVALHAFTRRAAGRATLAEFVAWMRGQPEGAHLGRIGRDLYLAWGTDVLDAALRRDLDLGGLFPRRLGVVHAAVWIGGDGAHTPLHFDAGADNLHAVVHGAKRFVFVPPGAPVLRADVYEWSTTFAAVDVRRPDAAARLAASAPLCAVAKALYRPPAWQERRPFRA